MSQISINTNRVSTYSFNQKMKDLNNRSYTNVNNKLEELSQGGKHSNFSEINDTSKIPKLIDTQNLINKSKTAAISIISTSSILEMTALNIDEIIKALTSLRSQISTSNLQNSNLIVVENIDNIKDTVTSLLNYRHNSQYIFSGTKTNIPAIKDKPPKSYDCADNLTNFDNIEDIKEHFNTKYYSGNSQLRTLLISKDKKISYGATANNEAFQLCMVALDYIKDTELTGKNVVSTAMSLLDISVNKLEYLKSEIAYQNRMLLQIKPLQENIQTYNESYIKNILYPENNMGTVMTELNTLVSEKSINEALSSIAINISESSLKFY